MTKRFVVGEALIPAVYLRTVISSGEAGLMTKAEVQAVIGKVCIGDGVAVAMRYRGRDWFRAGGDGDTNWAQGVMGGLCH